MMKLLTRYGIRLFFIAASTLLAMNSWAATTASSSNLLLQYREGVHYEKVPTKPANIQPTKAGNVSVIEFFSYGCPHCFAVQPALAQWIAHKPATVEFQTMPAYWNSYFQLMAQTYYTLVVLKQEKLHDKIFNAIHAQGRSLQTPEEVENYLVEQGLNRAQVHKTLNSFAVMNKVKMADQVFRGYGLSGVPTFLVGGQYMTNVGMAGGPENVFKVVEFLVQKVKSGK